MPKKSAKKFFAAQQSAQSIKRLALLVSIVALMVMALGRFGLPLDFLAARAQSSAEPQSEARKLTRDDCNYLRDPEGFKSALARHREDVSRATGLLMGTMAQSLSEEASLVPPQSIPRKNYIDNIIFD